MQSKALFSTELEFAIDQVLRRSAIDEEFRTLALSQPGEALGKFNPRFWCESRLRFAEDGGVSHSAADVSMIFLPPISAAAFHLSDVELEEFIGAQCGNTNCSPATFTCGVISSCVCTNCCITNC